MALLPGEEVLRAAALDPWQVKGVLDSSAMARWVQALGPEPPSAWLVHLDGEPLTLRRYQPYQSETDVAWEHEWAARLAGTGFPAPRPVKAFSGRSWARIIGDELWGMMTYLPGRPLLWEEKPGLEEVGAFLAQYHATTMGLQMAAERPTGTPLSRLRELARWDRVEAGLGERGRVRRFEALLHELTQELDSMGYTTWERTVIHGDFTTDNVIVDGEPPRIVGCIDYGFTYQDARLADLAFALWRSGRGDPAATALATDRVTRFVAGYHDRRPLTAPKARAVPLLIMARGLQLVVRWTRRATPQQAQRLAPVLAPTLNRTEWVREHQRELEEAITAAIKDTPRKE